MIDVMDLHTHTLASGHAYNTIYEMARTAADKGLPLLGITDHTPSMPISVPQSYVGNFKHIPRKLYGVKMMFGAELNILDYEGHVDLPSNILDKLDYAVASIHRPCYEPGTAAQNTAAYLGAMKIPKVCIIGHPDDNRFPLDYEALVCGAKEHKVLLEVNNNSLNPRCVRQGARENYLTMLDYCKKYQVPIIPDSDAHCEVDVANHSLAHAFLQEIDFPEELVVNRSLEVAAEYIPFLKKMLNEETNA